MLNNHFSKAKYSALAVAVTALLSACGGGGSGNTNDNSANAVFDVQITPSQDIILPPGSTIPLMASAQTTDAPLATLSWSVSSATTAPNLGIINGDCSVGDKLTNQKSSSWNCQLGITAPVKASDSAKYTAIFKATDTRGNTRTTSRNIFVAYDPNYVPPVIAPAVLSMPAFSVISGGTAPLSCPAAAGSTISWNVDANGNLPIGLYSYNSAQTTFVAPTVTTPTTVQISCTTIDAAKNISAGSVSITILPLATPVPTGVTVSPAQSVVAGATAAVTLTLTGITVPVYYQWTLVGNPSPSVTLSGASTSTVSFVSATVATTTTYNLLVVYGLQPITSTYTGIGQAQAVVVVTPHP